MATVRVKPTHPESQGPYVILDSAQFDPAVHQLYVEPGQAPAEAPAPAAPAQDHTQSRLRVKRGQR